ncbi:response regulator [Clostridium omnivorum]|uniref:Stage 0 sporulation protein A homolog n=1 Tax=Clostridium omnivorum TaxID=1604902 RepID=A0ABQ5N1C1_9CLOT|nr:response regulator transcription factor [Clostridium sp. E14]GLC29000.1 DNA-binding response regulator [Clostridium sp. E14]
MKAAEISVLIADDHELIREGLKKLMSLEDDLKLVGEARDGEEAIGISKKNKVDVMVLDFNMPKINGIEVMKMLKEEGKDIKVIILTIENDRRTLNQAIEMGADGYVLKESSGIEIVNAIRTVYGGEKYIDKTLVSLLFSQIKKKDKGVQNIIDSLTKREMEILIKLSKGLSNKEIGQQLYLSEKTVKNYVSNIFKKINTDDRVKATIFALENRIESYYNSVS